MFRIRWFALAASTVLTCTSLLGQGSGLTLLNDTSSMTGSGTLLVSGGTVSLNSGATYNVTGTTQLTSGSLYINSGSSATATIFNQSGVTTLGGAGVISITGPFSWTSGEMRGGGTTTANGGMAIGGSGNKDLLTRTLNNTGTTTWGGAGYIRVGEGSVINNSGVWDAQSDTYLYNPFSGSAAFVNTGTFKKSAGSATTFVGIPMTNTGTIAAQSRTLSLGYANAGSTSSGALTGSTGATLQFNGGIHDLNSGSSVSGTARFLVSVMRRPSLTSVVERALGAVVHRDLQRLDQNPWIPVIRGALTGIPG